MGIENITLKRRSPLAEGTLRKGGLNREYQITPQDRPADPPPMRPAKDPTTGCFQGAAREGAPPAMIHVPQPERASREGDQPIPTPGGQSVFAAVREWLDEREATGIKRYGRSLETFNNRDAGRDAREEALDLLMYVEQMHLEAGALVTALLVLAKFIRSREKVGGHGGAPAGVRAALELAQKLEATR